MQISIRWLKGAVLWKHSGSLMELEPVNERIIRARFISRHIKLTVIQCHALTNDASEEEKETFYLALHYKKAQVPKHDILVVLVDLNAKKRSWVVKGVEI